MTGVKLGTVELPLGSLSRIAELENASLEVAPTTLATFSP